MSRLDEKQIAKLVDKFQKRADTAERSYQEAGISRYYTTYWNNQSLADALRIALTAKEDHDALCDMRMLFSNFASRGAAAMDQGRPENERVELAMRLAQEIAEYGQRNDLI